LLTVISVKYWSTLWTKWPVRQV